MSDEIEITNQIKLYFHCGTCMLARPADKSPAEWGQIEAGWTPRGFQVWCKRCNANVVHVDFEGAKHPATMRKAS